MWLGRSSTESTWEPVSSLPPQLVANYEAGILYEVQRESFTTGGQTVHTLTTTPTKELDVLEPVTKHARIDLSHNNCEPTG